MRISNKTKILTLLTENPGIELDATFIAEATGVPIKQVRSNLSAVLLDSIVPDLVRTGLGKWTYKPKEGIQSYQNQSDKLYAFLKSKKGSATVKEIADHLEIHITQVYAVVQRMNKYRGVKAKRETKYVIK